MKALARCAAALCLSLLASASLAQVVLSGVKFEDSVDVRGNKLVLNGAGLRVRLVFKGYAAGLYVAKKADTPDAVTSAPGAKRISVTMLREFDAAEIGQLFARGIEDNNDKATFAKISSAVARMGQLFAEQKRLMPGDQFMVDWVPGTGAIVTVKGVQQGEPFKEPEFYGALLRIWLGPNPADANLKDALLGKPA